MVQVFCYHCGEEILPGDEAKPGVILHPKCYIECDRIADGKDLISRIGRCIAPVTILIILVVLCYLYYMAS